MDQAPGDSGSPRPGPTGRGAIPKALWYFRHLQRKNLHVFMEFKKRPMDHGSFEVPTKAGKGQLNKNHSEGLLLFCSRSQKIDTSELQRIPKVKSEELVLVPQSLDSMGDRCVSPWVWGWLTRRGLDRSVTEKT